MLLQMLCLPSKFGWHSMLAAGAALLLQSF
jgi:hypothetical protein